MHDKGYKIEYKFNAMHNIKDNFIENAHSHTFYVNFYVEFKNKEMINMTFFQKLIPEYFSKYTGQFLNTIFPFDELPPTIENMAFIFHNDLKPLLAQNDIELLAFDLGDSPFGLFSLSESENDQNVVFPNFKDSDIKTLSSYIFSNN